MSIGNWIITLFLIGVAGVCAGAYFATGWGLAAGIAVLVGSIMVAALTEPEDADRHWPERRR